MSSRANDLALGGELRDDLPLPLDVIHYGGDNIIARSASSVRGHMKSRCSSVRSSVRSSSVRKIIDFCEEYMKGAHVLLSTGTLRLRFSRIQKVIVAK